MEAFKQPKFGTGAATHFAALLERFLKPVHAKTYTNALPLNGVDR